ncbi:MAG: ATP-binding protein, partial [Chloroflexia bacterium]
AALLRSLLSLGGPDPERLSAALEALHPNLRLRLPLLADVLGLAMPDNEVTRHLDARQRQEAALALVTEVVRRHAQATPLLLLLEDAHWMDPPSWDLALAVGRAVEDLPVLLCLVQRPVAEEEPWAYASWSQIARLPHHRLLALEGLAEEGVVALARQELRAGAVSEEIGRLLVERSQGNPLFVQEIVHALQEGGAVAVAAGRACLCRPLDEIAIPDTVHGVVLSRLDRLDKPTKLTLKVAAVIGCAFSVSTLRGIHPAPPPEEELCRQLAQMERLSIARLESREPDLTYIFHHAITQEVAYSTLVSAQRRSLHRRVAEWHEQTFAENLAPHYGLLAHHYERAGLEDRWVLYLGRMAEEAGRRYAPDVAIEAYGRLRAILERWAAGDPPERAGRVAQMVALDSRWGHDALPEKATPLPPVSPDERLLRARLRAALGLADALDLRGRWEEERVRLESLRPLVERSDDRALAIALGMRRAALVLNSGDPDAGRRLAEEVLALARQEGDLPTQVHMLNGRGRAAELRGDIEMTRREARKALRLARRIHDERNAGIALILLGNACNATGQAARAARYFERALAAERAAEDRSWEIVALNNLGTAWIYGGWLDRGRECLEQVLNQARLIGDLETELMAMANLGAIDLQLGRYDQAEARLGRARRLFQKMGRQDAEAEALECLAEVALCRGEIPGDLALADEARAMRQARGLQTSPSALLIRARILEEAGRWSEAQEVHLALSRLVQAQAGRPSADAAAGLARCALACGDRDGARAFLEEALRLLGEGKSNAEDPALVYLTAYRLWATLEQPEQARACLARGRRLLRRQAARIADPQMRRSFLQGVPVRRQITAACASTPGPAQDVL